MSHTIDAPDQCPRCSGRVCCEWDQIEATVDLHCRADDTRDKGSEQWCGWHELHDLEPGEPCTIVSRSTPRE